jgi:hypothetical protein
MQILKKVQTSDPSTYAERSNLLLRNKHLKKPIDDEVLPLKIHSPL